MFIDPVAYNGRPRIIHGDAKGQRAIVVPDNTTTHMAPYPQPGSQPKYIDAKVLMDAGMKVIEEEDGGGIEFLKPDGQHLARGEHFILPSR